MRYAIQIHRNVEKKYTNSIKRSSNICSMLQNWKKVVKEK